MRAITTVLFVLFSGVPAVSQSSISESISPKLRGKQEARSAARFCLGYIKRDFEQVAGVAHTYGYQRHKWQQSLPESVARQRYQDMLGRDRETFRRGQPVFYMEFGRLAYFLRPGARVLVTDLKEGTTTFQNANFTNAFVQITYPTFQASPQIGNRRLKRTYLVVPVHGQWVLTQKSGPLQQSLSNFLPKITRLQEADEYW